MRLRWRRGQKVGKYQLGRKIGEGGFARVYEAIDLVQDMQVALKVPTEADEDDLEDLLHEIRVVSKLDHPNVLQILNADYLGHDVLLVAYPLGQRSLFDRMDHRISTKNVLKISEQILSGLAYAHERGVIHCDVKPDNVICFDNGHVKLGDFGLSKTPKNGRSGPALTVKTSSPGGTLGYMAPELAMGHPSPRSDVFSAGVLIYELFTREMPIWPFDWPPPKLDKIERKAPELVPVLRRALRPKAADRFPHAGAMLEAFQREKRKVLRRLDNKS